MISHDTHRQRDAGSPASLLGNVPERFQPDDVANSQLAGFPVNLLYSQIADPKTDMETAKFLLMMCAFDPATLLGDKRLCKKVRAVWYYPDRATYIEDGHKRQMQYRSRKGGDHSITVSWDKDQNRWETRKYKGDELILLACGKDFNSAMWQTTAFGPQIDEVLDTQ